MKAIKIISLILSIFLISSFFYGCTADSDKSQTTKIECPWDEKGPKQPSDYSWEEFEALSGEEQMEFQLSFGNTDKFESWMNKAQAPEVECPWDEKGAKQPSDYTWEEFEKLDEDVQIRFQNSFDKQKDFEEWMNDAQSTEDEATQKKEDSEATSAFTGENVSAEDVKPTEEEVKKPSELTWEEFSSLSAEEQMSFQKSFGSISEFEKWLNEAQFLNVELPWNEKGAKQPSAYSWEEYEALNEEQQVAFQKSFENTVEFEKWMNEAQIFEVECPWDEKGAKQPSDYTWDEFEALSGPQQIEFQKSFGSTDKFKKWLTANQP